MNVDITQNPNNPDLLDVNTKIGIGEMLLAENKVEGLTPDQTKELLENNVDALNSLIDQVKSASGYTEEVAKAAAVSMLSKNNPKNNPQSKGITVKRDQPKIGRNELCPCGSGKKYKKCCLK